MPSVDYDDMISYMKGAGFRKYPKIKGKKKPDYLWYCLFEEPCFVKGAFVKLPFKKRKKYKKLDDGWFQAICIDIFAAFEVAKKKEILDNPFVSSDAVKVDFKKRYGYK